MALSFFLFLAIPRCTQNFPHQGSNLLPLQWNGWVLTTGSPGKSDFWHLENVVRLWHIVSVFQDHWLHTQEASIGLNLLLSNFPFFGREVPRKRSHGKKQRNHSGVRVPHLSGSPFWMADFVPRSQEKGQATAEWSLDLPTRYPRNCP